MTNLLAKNIAQHVFPIILGYICDSQDLLVDMRSFERCIFTMSVRIFGDLLVLCISGLNKTERIDGGKGTRTSKVLLMQGDPTPRKNSQIDRLCRVPFLECPPPRRIGSALFVRGTRGLTCSSVSYRKGKGHFEWSFVGNNWGYRRGRSRHMYGLLSQLMR